MSKHVEQPACAGAQRTHLMTVGDWSILLTASGAGASQWRGQAINRWHEDVVGSDFGSFILLKDAVTGESWSSTWQPVLQAPDAYSVEFAEGSACFRRADRELESSLTVAIGEQGDTEVRAIELCNRGTQPRTMDVISAMELVLGDAAADAAHPAFSKMFVQTAQLDDGETLLAWRRKRNPDEPDVFAAHLCVSTDPNVSRVGFETDRMRFVGRGRDLRRSQAMETRRWLAGRCGTVLDPMFALCRQVFLPPQARVELAFWTVAAESRAVALIRASQCRASGAVQRAVDATRRAARRRLSEQSLDDGAVERFQRLVTPLIYCDRAWRAPAAQVERAGGGVPLLWAHAISGDHPIALLRIGDASQLGLVRDVLQAQAWWRAMNRVVDVVLLAIAPEGETHDDPVTAKALRAQLEALCTQFDAAFRNAHGKPGCFVLVEAELSPAERDGLAAAARVVLDARDGDLAAQLQRRDVGHASSSRRVSDRPPPRPVGASSAHAETQTRSEAGLSGESSAIDGSSAAAKAPTDADFDPDSLEFFNGFGGFADEGREYRMVLDGAACTPMPWVNIIANADFGFMVSAEGGGYCWSGNSQTNPLTPWWNDPASDPAGDILYLRDLDNHRLWTATPQPIRAADGYRIRHGRGYSRFEHTCDGISVDLLQFVPLDDPLKVSRLRLHNRSARARRLQVTAFVEWALGANGQVVRPFVVTGCDRQTGALTARNDWRADFPGRLAFADLGGRQSAFTCDRREFFGLDGDRGRPAALEPGVKLSGACGALLDPCAALQAEVSLAPGETQDVLFLLGEVQQAGRLDELLQRYRTVDPQQLLDDVVARWDSCFDAVQVRTPNRRLDLMVNGWLPYQVLSCRIHARTAFYQASGAWGFRDQLQDAGALLMSEPAIAREHLLRAAGRQFEAGDVQHWWLPPTGAGVRTRIVDDRLWLPWMVAQYVRSIGDAAVLDEPVPFLDGAALSDGQVDSFFIPQASQAHGSLFEHCARAIDVSLPIGVHGLPLFGTGDWNDGMNRVGQSGRGESVWMGWFLHATLSEFLPLAQARGETAREQAWRQHAEALASALDAHAWDGQWWKRGWYDDGAVLGSQENLECRIDGIAQSWSVISGVAAAHRARSAMDAVDRLLVRRDARLVSLLDPPFDAGKLDPGYIRGYPPGIRENGAQYTHGSVWAVIAFAMLGDGDRAGELFDMLNPLSHADSPQAVANWKVEPYVACADVYTAPGHLGRGGWSWYTGSAGWLFRAATEWMLGVTLHGARMRLDPCIPRGWPGFSFRLRWRSAVYRIEVSNPAGVCRGISQLVVDDQACAASDLIDLHDDGCVHEIRAVLG